MRYILRYTNDLHRIDASDNLAELKRRSDYKIHVWDTKARKVVWQNGPSDRYGTVGVWFDPAK